MDPHDDIILGGVRVGQVRYDQPADAGVTVSNSRLTLLECLLEQRPAADRLSEKASSRVKAPHPSRRLRRSDGAIGEAHKPCTATAGKT
jgi:hypothetical protein